VLQNPLRLVGKMNRILISLANFFSQFLTLQKSLQRPVFISVAVCILEATMKLALKHNLQSHFVCMILPTSAQ